MRELFLPAEERQALRQALHLLEIDRKRFSLSVLFGTGAIGSGIGLGAVSAWLIARAAQLPPVLDLSVAATSVRAFGVGKAIFRYLERISSHWVALDGMAALRTRLYDQLASAPADVVAQTKRGDLLARTGADVDELGDFVVKSLLPAAVAILTGLLSVAIVCALSPAIGLCLLFALLVSGVVAPAFAMTGARQSESARITYRAQLNVAALMLLENASELQVSQRIHAVDQQRLVTEQAIQNSRDVSARSSALASALDILALGASIVCALVIGASQVAAGTLSELNLVVCTLTPLAAFESTQRLSPAAVQLVRSAQAAKRIMDLLNSAAPAAPNEQHVAGAAAVEHSAETVLQPNTTNCLTATDLHTGWPGGPTVAGPIDLKLQPGKTIAVVGPSGIGKSTLLCTLAGLIEPHAGSVLLGNVPVHTYDRRTISNELIYIAEDAHIFETSVLENLRVIRSDLTPNEAQQLLELAGLGSWIAQLPDGVETVIGADAASISGGERRRLLLARALASRAPFILLDEPGEHLDALTADQLMSDLFAATRSSATAFAHSTDAPQAGYGLIVVTHRLSALRDVDEIIVLGGAPAHIVARGRHDELLASTPQYKWAWEQEQLAATSTELSSAATTPSVRAATTDFHSTSANPPEEQRDPAK